MLRIDFDLEAMKNAGATVKLEVAGSGKGFQKVLYFNEHKMNVPDAELPYVCMGELHGEPPKDLEEFITEVSYYDNFGYGFHPTRRLGEYRLASAVGELEAVGTSHYHLKLRAKNVKDLRELFHLVRQGQIWPAKDYEEAQVPPPFRHLKDALAEVWELIRRDIRDRLYRIKERVINFAA